MNNTGGPVDVWEAHGVDPDTLMQSPEGSGSTCAEAGFPTPEPGLSALGTDL